MPTERIIAAVLLVFGIVLLVMGIRETESFGSQMSEFFTGSFSDRAVWMMIGGVAIIILAASVGRLSSKKTNL